MGKTLINLHQNSSTPFVPSHCLVSNLPKKGYFLLSHVLMPNGIPIQRDGGRNFVSPFAGGGLLESVLSSDLFPTKLGQVSKERSNLLPPPTCWIKEKLIQLPKEYGELGMCTTLCQFVHPNTWQPPWKSHERSRIPHFRFHLSKSKIFSIFF